MKTRCWHPRQHKFTASMGNLTTAQEDPGRDTRPPVTWRHTRVVVANGMAKAWVTIVYLFWYVRCSVPLCTPSTPSGVRRQWCVVFARSTRQQKQKAQGSAFPPRGSHWCVASSSLPPPPSPLLIRARAPVRERRTTARVRPPFLMHASCSSVSSL